MVESKYKKGIKKYFGKVKFDMVMYSTPPITLANVIKFVKKRDGAKSYLLLKDIFPQNAVDIGMMSKGVLYKYFRNKEKKLYALSDRIGCMSAANVDYVLKNNKQVPSDKVEICPNAISVRDMELTASKRDEMRDKYGIPRDKTVFVYGGNLGKPQDIPFIIKCLEKVKDNKDTFFLVVGNDTEYPRLEEYVKNASPENLRLMKSMPKEEYDSMIASCDVGLIFLDHRFTIPNFPSRLLSYMQAKLPVLACTDRNTDMGKVITEGGFGWWCESNSADEFSDAVADAMTADLKVMGENGYRYLKKHYTVEVQYGIIEKSLGFN